MSKTICKACDGLGVKTVVRDGDRRHVSVPCSGCAKKRRCPECGRRKRGANHDKGAHHMKGKVS